MTNFTCKLTDEIQPIFTWNICLTADMHQTIVQVDFCYAQLDPCRLMLERPFRRS